MLKTKKDEIEQTDFNDGNCSISIPVEIKEIMEEQRRRFVEKFGREPGPEEFVFFDPDADVSQPFPEDKLMELLVEAIYRNEIDEKSINNLIKTFRMCRL